MTDLLRQARGVLLPAIDTLTLSDPLRDHLRGGGRSVLLGETREEYVARRMTDGRRSSERAADVRSLVAEARALAGEPVLIAADVELGGIERFASLVPPLPERGQLEVGGLNDAQLSEACERTANGLLDLGVNLVLAPIVDSLDAPNGWLDGRHLGPDTDRVARLAEVFVRAFEGRGVATTVKHFPGHRGLATDPAVDAVALVPADARSRTGAQLEAALEAGLAPFRRALPMASCVMTGPGTIAALDPERPALLSSAVIDRLGDDLGWSGLIISDGLEMAAVLAGGQRLEDAAVEALAAGNDLLLVGAGEVDRLATALADAVHDGRLTADRLAQAAARVAHTARARGTTR